MSSLGLGLTSYNTSAIAHIAGLMAMPAILQPSSAWTGEAGSGFAQIPVDPVRTTAKPACRILVPPHQHFTDTLDFGVIGAANENGSLINTLGIAEVRFHFEGSVRVVDAPRFHTIMTSRGPRRYFGWWVRLKKPAGMVGAAHLYVEAIPRDVSMQCRVLGPFPFHPTSNLYQFNLTVNPDAPVATGQNFHGLGPAIAWLKAQSVNNARIIMQKEGMYDFRDAGTQYNGGTGYLVIEATAPVTFGFANFISDSANTLRPSFDGIWFRGPNITFDLRNALEIWHNSANSKGHVFDGVNIINSAGRGATWRLGTRPIGWFARGRDRHWFLEMHARGAGDVCKNAILARGCNLKECYNDIFTDVLSVVDCVVDDHDSTIDWAFDDPAITIQGPAGATLSRTSSTGVRTFTARVGSTIIGSFVTGSGEAYFNRTSGDGYTVQDMANWINGLGPGWSASVISNAKQAAIIGTPGNKGLTNFSNVSVSSPTTFVIYYDLHSDFYQQTLLTAAPEENVILWGNRATNMVSQNFFIPSRDKRDWAIINNATYNKVNNRIDSLLSQFSKNDRHVMFVHNTQVNQFMSFRSAWVPDSYCLFANNALRGVIVEAGMLPPVGLNFSDNHFHSGQFAPSFASNSTFGGDATSLYGNPALGDFSPLGALLDNLKPPRIIIDTENEASVALAPIGAILQ